MFFVMFPEGEFPESEWPIVYVLESLIVSALVEDMQHYAELGKPALLEVLQKTLGELGYLPPELASENTAGELVNRLVLGNYPAINDWLVQHMKNVGSGVDIVTLIGKSIDDSRLKSCLSTSASFAAITREDWWTKRRNFK
jgi:hypothetical protein